MPHVARPARTRNDPAQYDDLTDEWWAPRGKFVALHWLARARAALIPPPPYPGAALLDVACGAGLLAPHLHGPGADPRLAAGWRHTGIDLSMLSLRQARAHGVAVVRADALRLPYADGTFACVVAGEVLEHLTDLDGACAELARVLAPGGTLVIDTLNDTRLCRLALIRFGEGLPAMAPRGVHDPELLVAPARLAAALGRHGVRLGEPTGLRPSTRDVVAWLLHRAPEVRMLPTRSVATVYQVVGHKPAQRAAGGERATARVSTT